MYWFLLLVQSLDYDNCENELYLQEERRQSLKVSLALNMQGRPRKTGQILTVNNFHYR